VTLEMTRTKSPDEGSRGLDNFQGFTEVKQHKKDKVSKSYFFWKK
jgi:hypothetical protein